jgi:AcrR family transcriptional regulator
MSETDRSSIKKAVRPKQTSRLSKEQWLERSMNFLEKRGPAAMSLDALTRHLGVTTGSFYWHFKSHAGFLEELTDKYIQDFTLNLVEHLSTLDLPPREILREAMWRIIEYGLGGMDIHFRSLASTYPRVAVKVRAMDELRAQILGDLFEAMGYTGDELHMRLHNFMVVNSMEHGVHTGLSRDDRLKLFDERVKLLID